MSDFEGDLVDGLSDVASDTSSEAMSETANAHLEKCLFGNTNIELPIELVENVSGQIYDRLCSKNLCIGTYYKY